MTEPDDIFSEIREHYRSKLPLKQRYSRLYALLQRLCAERSDTLGADFSGLFSRLYAVCKAAHIDYHEADRFRRHARLVLFGESSEPPTEERFRDDVALLCAFVCRLYDCALPADMPVTSGSETPVRSGGAERKLERLRGIVGRVASGTFECVSVEGRFEVDMSELPRTAAVLREGQTVNLLGVRLFPDGQAQVRHVIIEPDYLVDVSALTAAVKPYGASAANYLLDLLSSHESTCHTLLGDAANQFMDDLVNTSLDLSDDAAMAQLYAQSLRRHFLDNVLQYVCLSSPLPPDYFEQLKRTFSHIRHVVAVQFPTPEVKLYPEEVFLEPSFVCESLGLRGRLDVMSAGHDSLVELKSGRAVESFGRCVGPQAPHILQMSLYREMLHYNLGRPRDAVRSFLLYSRYPVLYDQRPSARAVTDILELRNEIVALEERIRTGCGEDVLSTLTPDSLNSNHVSGKFWNQYLLPQISAITEPLRHASPLERAYFLHFLTFVEREKFLAKVGDGHPEASRCQASAWLSDLPAKQGAGDILTDLRISDVEETADGIEAVTFALPDYGADFIANFTPGEMVQCYERTTERDNVTTRQLVRGYVESLDATRLTFRLAYRQRNRRIFPPHARYAVEHDASDALSAQSVRNLFSLLCATPSRRALLLGQRSPEVDASPAQQPPVAEGSAAHIVNRVRCARDYFLLVGPPGTGKTSVVLRALVQDHLLCESQRQGPSIGLLLTAYTNRAVDEICGVLEDLRTDYVRLGVPQTCAEAYRPHLLPQLFSSCMNRDAARRRLLETPVVVATVATLSNHLELCRLRPFRAIIDEASQVLEPQLLGLLCARGEDGHSAIRQFVMIGDHKQLPAVVRQSSRQSAVTDPLLLAIGLDNLRNSLFQRLHTLQTRSGREDVVAMLDRQGRMHPDICRFVNAAFYDGCLRPVPLPHQEQPLLLKGAETPYEHFVASTRMGFVNIAPRTLPPNPKANADEAAAVACLVRAIITLCRRNAIPLDAARQVGVIVPFRNQIAMVRRALRQSLLPELADITVDTVECYQGSQRDYIIFSTTVSRPAQLGLLSEPQPVGDILVDRKLNVALTRARQQFFIVGNGNLLSASPLYRGLIAACTPFEDSSASEEESTDLNTY